MRGQIGANGIEQQGTEAGRGAAIERGRRACGAELPEDEAGVGAVSCRRSEGSSASRLRSAVESGLQRGDARPGATGQGTRGAKRSYAGHAIAPMSVPKPGSPVSR